jgi:predicted RNA-binding protein
MTRYFLICASRDHVMTGVKGGFAQAGHGRKDLMSKPAKGDMIVYYSAKDIFEGGKPLQKFTAIGEVTDDEPYQPDANSTFKPYRRNVHYKKAHEADIRPLLDKLEFIKNKTKWGFYLMGGFRELSKEDFEVVEGAMKAQ